MPTSFRVTENKAKYVLDTFRRIYGLHEHDVDISYGIDGASKIQIRRSEFDSRGNSGLDASKVVWKTWRDERIPFLFDLEDREILALSETGATINFDIIAASFYLLSGQQEIDCRKRDQYGRFPFSESIQHKLKIIETPVVNYYFDILKTAIESVYDVQLRVNLWRNFDFAACITHDIDTCQSAWLQGSFDEIKQRRFFAPFKLVWQKLFEEDAWFNFEEILAIEREFDAHSSFYFLCRQGSDFGVENADYDIGDKVFQGVYDTISSNGSEIGIHGSFGTHNHLDQFQNDLKKLNFKAIGNRFHFLEFEIDKTPRILAEADILYDTTLGFAEHYGFRNSFCFPFYLYDIENDLPLSIVEIPLVLMDATLQFPKYMNLKPVQVLTQLEGLINQVKRFGGCFTILWHNTHFSDYKFTGWKDVFVELLRVCKGNNAFLASGQEIFEEFERGAEIS